LRDGAPSAQTSRDRPTAARTKSENSGAGANGLDFSSVWNCALISPLARGAGKRVDSSG
jgi:hypothetical protein